VIGRERSAIADTATVAVQARIPAIAQFAQFLRATACASALLLATGCPGSKPTTSSSTNTPGDAQLNTTLGDGLIVQASAHGADENEAYAAARKALAEAVLGDAAWADLLDLEVHRRNTDPQRVTAMPVGVEVTLGLSRERAALVVQALAEAEPEPRGPEVWHEALSAALRAHSAADACRQRTKLFGVACEPSPTDEADAAIAELGKGLMIVSAYPDGVPVNARGRALREPTLFASWRGGPLGGLPLRIEAEDPSALALDQVTSDGTGKLRVALVDGVKLPAMRLVIDGEALLGPLREAAPQVEVRIAPREVGLGRWAVAVVRGAAPDEAAAAVRSRLVGSGLGEPQSLGARDEAALRGAPADRRARKIGELADAMAGRVDLLLVLSYDTRFASRMAGGRLWYEAEGTLEAYDAWTGKLRAKASTRVEADGVGDERAEAAARKKLAEALAADMLGKLREAGPR
jgi:hypothetical protein